MSDTLHVPTFARITDYIGLWACEPLAFQTLWTVAKQMDLAAHFKEPREEPVSAVEMIAGPGGKSIALVKMTGLLMKSASSMGGTSTIQLRKDIRNAAADPNVSGILLAADTPGGTVAGTSDLADEVKAAGKVKPVWAHADDLLASAGYWVTSQASRITANSPTALVGSIGTIQVVNDMSAYAEREGIKTLVFSTGPLKGTGVAGAKVTDEQQAHLQGLVNAVQVNFDEAVRKGRGMSAKELLAVRHGGVLTATAALDAKLIDGIQPLSKTIAEFSQSLKSGMAAESRMGGLPMRELSGLPMRQA